VLPAEVQHLLSHGQVANHAARHGQVPAGAHAAADMQAGCQLRCASIKSICAVYSALLPDCQSHCGTRSHSCNNVCGCTTRQQPKALYDCAVGWDASGSRQTTMPDAIRVLQASATAPMQPWFGLKHSRRQALGNDGTICDQTLHAHLIIMSKWLSVGCSGGRPTITSLIKQHD
jgi:hypothetical protein